MDTFGFKAIETLDHRQSASSVAQTFNDDVALKLGTGGTVSVLYETADANANALIFAAPEGGATDVPVFVFGDASIVNVDLGLFNGITQPTIAVIDSDADSYLKLSYSGDDVALIQSNRPIELKPSGDTDDYFTFSTAADIPTITATGAIGVRVEPKLSIGTDPTDSTGILHVTDTVGKGVVFERDGQVQFTIGSYGSGNVGLWVAKCARGTIAAPTAVQSGDLMFALCAQGYGTNAWGGIQGAFIVSAAEAWTNANNGTIVDVRTIPTGGATASVVRAEFLALGGMQMPQVTTEPGATADRAGIYCIDVSSSAVLGIFTETAVAVDADETKFSHKLPVRVNGATYYIMLTAT